VQSLQGSARLPFVKEIMSHELKWLRGCDNLSRIFSTCSKRQYFSVVLAPNKRVLSTGYNGSPPGYPHCDEGHCPRAVENSPSGSNYDNCIANHAEANALLWCDAHARVGATLIVNGTPCYGCAKLIASSGISRVVGFLDPSYGQLELVKSFLFATNVDLMLIERKGRYPAIDDAIQKRLENAYMKRYKDIHTNLTNKDVYSGTRSSTEYHS